MAKMPKQKPGQSEQTVGTPKEFLNAVRFHLGIADFDIDLAADSSNTVCPSFYDEEDNSLVQPWKVGSGWNWCNPPFGDIEPWVRKAYEESELGAKTAMLLPASVGSNYWKRWVHNRAQVLLLNGRLTFVGHDKPYPKDLVLLLYSRSFRGGYDVWSWRLDA